MRSQARWAVTVVALVSAALMAGCGSTAPAGRAPAPEAPPAGAPFLATSLATADSTWAVAVMGGSVATHDNFWQLFARPAGSPGWKLVTPPGVPDNGGLVLADGGHSLIAGFRPSQYLTYTPLSATADGGQAWSSTGPLDGALANVPDALAADPGNGHLLALLTDGTAAQAAPSGYAQWATLASLRSLAATSPGRRCGLQNLTAAAFSPSGQPLLGGTCRHPGTAGIFAESGVHREAVDQFTGREHDALQSPGSRSLPARFGRKRGAFAPRTHPACHPAFLNRIAGRFGGVQGEPATEPERTDGP